jgi:hypothetical protein
MEEGGESSLADGGIRIADWGETMKKFFASVCGKNEKSNTDHCVKYKTRKIELVSTFRTEIRPSAWRRRYCVEVWLIELAFCSALKR